MAGSVQRAIVRNRERPLRYRPQFRTARDEFFGQKGPASTMVEVNHLSEPGYMIEIEAIAVI